MLLRLPVVAALAVALVLAPSASAAEVTPAPTAAVSVTYAGQPGPKTLTTATWLENKRGTNAQLSIDATNLPGMRSTVDAVWTTGTFKAYPKIDALVFREETSHTGVPTAALPADFSYGVRYRSVGGAWTPWFDQFRSAPADLSIVTGHYGETHIRFPQGTRTKIQMQLRIHVALADLGQESQVWKTFAAV